MIFFVRNDAFADLGLSVVGHVAPKSHASHFILGKAEEGTVSEYMIDFRAPEKPKTVG